MLLTTDTCRSPILRLYSFLYPKNKVPVSCDFSSKLVNHCLQQVTVMVDDKVVKTEAYPSPPVTTPTESGATPTESGGVEVSRGDHCYRLEDLAYLRSGDKGNSANIGQYIV